MLTAIRGQHAKKILWIVAGTVITAFVLSNASSFLEKKEAKATAKIGSQKVIIPNFKHYIDLARLDFILYSNLNNGRKTITPEAIIEKASIYYRLLFKAKEANIEVTDQEIVKWVNRNFSRGGKFDKASYQRYIKHISRTFSINLTPRSFEEYMRELITINELWAEFIQVAVSDTEIQSLYLIENQEAKIAYLFIPYEKFRVDVGIKPNEVEEFYQANKTLFEREPTANIKYALITEEDNLSSEEINRLAELGTLDQLEKKTSFKIKETGFIKKDDPIKEIGWKQEITQAAFDLEINQISPPIGLGRDFIIVGKEDEKPAFTPPLGEIEAEVEEKLIVSRAKKDAQRFSFDLLKRINEKGAKNLKKFRKKKNVEFKETGFFKYYDYIEGLGLDSSVSAIVFSLEKDEIHSEIVALDKGAYILQLKDKTSIDDADFQTKREAYHDKIEERKLFLEKLKFINKLNQEIIIELPPVK